MKKEFSKEVEKLIGYGYTDLHTPWPNYVQELNLNKGHSNELIELIRTSNLSHAISGFKMLDFGPRHAWRALGQLKIRSAVDPLLNALINKKNEEAFEYQIELPKVLLLIGIEIIPNLEIFLKNDRIDWSHKLVIVTTLINFALQNPNLKKSIIEILNELLINNKDNTIFISRILNEIFKLGPIESQIVRTIINKDKFDFATIDQEQLVKFLDESDRM